MPIMRRPGATIAPDAAAALDGADIVLKVRGPDAAAKSAQMKKGAVLAALLAPADGKGRHREAGRRRA